MATDTTNGSLADAIAAPGGDSREEVIPWGRAFLVDGHPDAPIELDQYTAKDFVFVGTLSFLGDMGLDEKKYPKITAEMKQNARALDGSLVGRSDLASVPRFLRWFELPYGRHTPAALIHDGLIFGGKPNKGRSAATPRWTATSVTCWRRSACRSSSDGSCGLPSPSAPGGPWAGGGG